MKKKEHFGLFASKIDVFPSISKFFWKSKLTLQIIGPLDTGVDGVDW